MRLAKIRKPNKLKCNRRLTCNFLRALFTEDLDEPNSFGWGGLNHANWEEVICDNFQRLSGKIAIIAKNKDVYFHVCTHDQAKTGKRGRKASALLLTAIYLDLDVNEKPNCKSQHNYAPREIAKKFLLNGGCPLKPSIIIESGSGGFHVYWLLKEPIIFDEQLVKRWQEHCRDWLGFDIDILSGAAQLMRIPGTINHKYSCLVDSLQFDDSLRYDPSDFEEYLAGVPKTSSLSTSTFTSSLRYTKDIEDKKKYPGYDETIIKNGGLEKFVHHPEIMLELARKVLGIDIKPNDFKQKGDYKKFCCILPGHEESNPSASLLWGDNDALLYQDFHGRDNQKSHSLTAVYAALHYKSVKTGMSPTENATWQIRMLIAGEIIPPANIKSISLPQNAPNSARRIYDGFVLLMQCRGHYTPDTPAAFAWSFAKAWCQIPSKGTIGEGFRWLKEHGYMVKVDEYTGSGRPMSLFRLGTQKDII